MKIKILFAAVALMMLLTSCDELGIGDTYGNDPKALSDQADAVTDGAENGKEKNTATDSENNVNEETNTDQNDEEQTVPHNLSWLDWRNRELIASLSESRGNAPAILISSVEELNAFIAASTADLLLKHDEIKKFDDADVFDEAYFEKYSLLIVYSGEHSGSMRHRIKSFSVENGTLSVTVENYYPSDIVTKDLTGRLLLFTLENVKLECCDGITVDVVLNTNENADVDPDASVTPEARGDGEAPSLPIEYNMSQITWRDADLSALLIDSAEKLNEFVASTGNTLDLSQKEDVIRHFDDADVFDEAYFEKYSLLIVYSGEHSSSMRHELTGFSCKDGSLYVTVRNYFPDDSATMDLTGRLLLFTFEKQAVEGCDSVNVNK